jgi:hypothetical protein
VLLLLEVPLLLRRFFLFLAVAVPVDGGVLRFLRPPICGDGEAELPFLRRLVTSSSESEEDQSPSLSMFEGKLVKQRKRNCLDKITK